MARCLQIYDSGLQCVNETIELTEFCDTHQRVIPFDRTVDSRPHRTIRVVAAFVILVMFLVPLFYSLKQLYWGPPAKAQEVW